MVNRFEKSQSKRNPTRNIMGIALWPQKCRTDINEFTYPAQMKLNDSY